MPRGRPLFESIFIFENHARSTGRGQAWAFERTSYPLSVIVGVGGELAVRILYDASLIDSEAVQRLAGRLRSALARWPRTRVDRSASSAIRPKPRPAPSPSARRARAQAPDPCG